MNGFRAFFEKRQGQEEQEDVRRTLAKIPPRHRDFLKGFSIHFQGTNTLNNDGEHVGVIQTHPRPQIVVAAPYFYAREFTVLHEIAHLVYANLLSAEMKRRWSALVKDSRIEERHKQSDEEMFSMLYAAAYTKHPPLSYYDETLIDFVKSVQ